MPDTQVVTSQPVPSAPIEETLHAVTESKANDVMQPTTAGENDMLTAEGKDEEEQERRRRRNEDFCCFACADSYNTHDDALCWYFFCRWYCECLGHCCQSVSNCTEACCEGCGECVTGCCDCLTGCCDNGGATQGADAADGCCDGCCDGDCDCGDCDCDCSCL